MRTNRPILASAAALAAFTLAAPTTGSAQDAEIEIVGVVDTFTEPSCALGPIAIIPDQTANVIYSAATSGPDGGRVDIIALAEQDGLQREFRAGLRADVLCTIDWTATISSDGDGMLNRDTGTDWVDYTAEVGVGTNTDSFSTTSGTGGLQLATVNLDQADSFVDVIIASLPDLPTEPLAEGTYVDVIFLEIAPGVPL